MRGGDSEFEGVNFTGTVTQFRFDPPLDAGEYDLFYDRDVGENVFLLFDAAVSVEFRILGADDKVEAPRDANGEYLLHKGDSYRIVTCLVDSEAEERKQFLELPDGTSFNAQDVGTPNTWSENLVLDESVGCASGDFPFNETGSYEFFANVNIPGFVWIQSDSTRAKVVDPRVDLKIVSENLFNKCNNREEAQIACTASRDKAGQKIVDFVLSADGELETAELTISTNSTSTILSVVDDRGVDVSGEPIEVEIGQPFSFAVLWKTPLAPAEIGASGNLELTVTPNGASIGTPLQIQREIKTLIPEARLVLEEYTRGDTAGPMKVTGAELVAGKQRAKYRIENALFDPIDYKVTAEFINPSWSLISPKVSIEGSEIFVAPNTNYLCLCFISFHSLLFGSDRTVQLRYSDNHKLQTAEAPLEIEDDSKGFQWFSCLLDFLILLALVWFVWAILAIFRTRRFPRRSVAEIGERGGGFKRIKRLRKRNFTVFRALLAPILGPPHEVATVEGLKMRAAPDGVEVLFGKRSPRWILGSLNQSFSELKEIDHSLKSYTVVWGETLIRQDNKNSTVVLNRDSRVNR